MFKSLSRTWGGPSSGKELRETSSSLRGSGGGGHPLPITEELNIKMVAFHTISPSVDFNANDIFWVQFRI